MRLRFLPTLGIAWLTATTAFAQSKPPVIPDVRSTQAQATTQKIPTWMRQTRVPGLAVAKIENGKVAWVEVFGERAPGVPLTRDTVFNVASLTKPVFALLTLQLAAERDLSLDTPLAQYWVDPDIADDERRLALTPRIVLSHQTGFQNWRGSAKLGFDFAPGARHEYSGEGYEYLRHAIEHKTGQPMRALMRAHVLDKAGMRSTSLGWSDTLEGKVATGFNTFAQPYDMAELKERQPSAAASMLTTIDDYARFAAWVANGAGLPRPLFDEMRRSQALHADPAEFFGLGWRLVQVGTETVLAHDGRENGVRTQVYVLPATHEGLVVLANSDNGELLIPTVVEATMTRGPQLMKQVAKDTWFYLGKQPASRLEPMMRTIANSPSFMAKLLHAVDATLLAGAHLNDAQAREARAAMDRFVLDMLNGRVGQGAALELTQMLVESTGTTDAKLRTRMTKEQAQAWIKALQTASEATAEAKSAQATAPVASVRVPDAVLASYVGSYLVPSSKLVVSITRAGDSLQATAKGMPIIQLHPESETRFFMKEDATQFEFVRNDKQAVVGLTLLWTGGRSEFASKIE